MPVDSLHHACAVASHDAATSMATSSIDPSTATSSCTPMPVRDPVSVQKGVLQSPSSDLLCPS